MKQKKDEAVKKSRCAIYTRKSTEEGLEKEFNSLDAQREAGEKFIESQRGEGWVCLADRYDDGGFTGGNVERPALKRLLAGIAAGNIDCVVVYKVDRLSRSLLDFTKIMATLDDSGVSFVSVTQQFNTTTSMGRLTLNILLSFAQFEREIISERTRDKIAATRRKGKWSGGPPVMGYDVAPGGGRIVVNEDEAARVRGLFETYLETQSLSEAIKIADARGWKNKRWTTQEGRERGGNPLCKNSLYKLLTNVLYIGKVTYKDEVHPGEQPALVDAEVFDRAQRLLKRNGATGGRYVRNRFGALLKGILRCSACECGMVHSHTKKGNRRYRYYICQEAQSRGWHNCPAPSIPASEIERFVINEIRSIGKDTTVLDEVIRKSHEQHEKTLKTLNAEKHSLGRELEKLDRGLRKLAARASDPKAADQLADLQDHMRQTEQRATVVREQIITLSREIIDTDEIAQACALFDPIWETLNPREQARIIHLLVESVCYDGKDESISITFHSTGIKTLAQELKEETKRR